jgi:hypothetical protein
MKSVANFLAECGSMLHEIADYETEMRVEYLSEMQSYNWRKYS